MGSEAFDRSDLHGRIRSLGYTTNNQTAEIVDLVLSLPTPSAAAQEMPPLPCALYTFSGDRADEIMLDYRDKCIAYGAASINPSAVAADDARDEIELALTADGGAEPSGREVLRQVFALCEATEDLKMGERFDPNLAGRQREAKGIRRAIGTWFQDETRATPHPAPDVAEPQHTFPTGALNPEWMVGKTAGELRAIRHGDDPAVAAEAGQVTPAQRLSELANGVRLGHCPDAGLLARRMDAIAAAINIRPSAEAGQWISVRDQVPELGTECIVWIARPTWAAEPYAAIDTWDVLREDPIGMGGPTIETGVGWGDNDFEDVSHWMRLPAAPTQPPAEGG